jgi:restriction system protein
LSRETVPKGGESNVAIPDYQSLMLPVLRKAERGEVRISDVIEELSVDLMLTPAEKAELLPSGRQTVFANRVHWAKTYLKQAGLVMATRRAHFHITDRGRAVLAQKPDHVDNKLLSEYPEFMEFKKRTAKDEQDLHAAVPADSAGSSDERTPDEIMRLAHRQVNEALAEEMLDRVIANPPEFFERVIVALLLAMEYGGSTSDAGRAIGRSGDDGVDGVIDQDPLGLDRVYVQAKRYKRGNNIGSGAIRDFFGSLDMMKASKGLFVTTSEFSASAKDTVAALGKRIVLIDGQQLAHLMVRYGVGCRVEETLYLKKLDEDFFD